MTIEQQLMLVSKAWGKQSGYAFFPRISGNARNKEERIQSYREGPAFLWPRDRSKIINYLEEHTEDDVYWCPSLFEKKRRKLEFAMDEHALWADLDETDPRSIDDYQPTIAWETSPGRYQCLWLIGGGFDIQGASWQGGENQKMTYYVGADVGGWDTTQLMRFPEWPNHKPEYRDKKTGEVTVMGKLLWRNGRSYRPDDFEDLPEVPRAGEFEDILEDQIDAVDRDEVWGKVRLKVSKRTRDLMRAREAVGERSDTLWSIERDLADAGLTAPEIVAVVQKSAWNKYVGRADELKRLTIEAGKAIAERPEKVKKGLDQEREGKPKPQDFFALVDSAKNPRWLIRKVWTEGACGFIAGQPKSWKSWIAMDMALSVATKSPFLGRFEVLQPRPVLYIQEEDSLPTLKARKNKVWPGKQIGGLVSIDGQATWLPPEQTPNPMMKAIVRAGFQISDEGWSAWLDEVLEEGYGTDEDGEKERYGLIVLDPLMMMLGDVEENRAADMTQRIFRPLKQLSEKYHVAICIVHHMRKGIESGQPVKGGQLMLGSVANHAWAEDALYVRHSKGSLTVEYESKSAPEAKFNIVNLRNRAWEPIVPKVETIEEDDFGGRPGKAQANGKSARHHSRSVDYLRRHGRASITEIAEALQVSRQNVHVQLTHAEKEGKVVRVEQGRGKRGRQLWDFLT